MARVGFHGIIGDSVQSVFIKAEIPDCIIMVTFGITVDDVVAMASQPRAFDIVAPLLLGLGSGTRYFKYKSLFIIYYYYYIRA